MDELELSHHWLVSIVASIEYEGVEWLAIFFLFFALFDLADLIFLIPCGHHKRNLVSLCP